ncbi:MAG: hypothetical protein ACLTAF_02550 [Blautia coccoides]
MRWAWFQNRGKWTPVLVSTAWNITSESIRSGSYILVEEETKTALTDTEVTPEVKSYQDSVSSGAELWVTGDDGACKRTTTQTAIRLLEKQQEADGTADIM